MEVGWEERSLVGRRRGWRECGRGRLDVEGWVWSIRNMPT
jgi:hypothetical protein